MLHLGLALRKQTVVIMQQSTLKQLGANATIVTFLMFIAVDALPSTCRGHQRLKDTLDPVLDATGLWQQSWQLFAPEPDSVNTRLSAQLHFRNGETISWNTPDYSKLTAWERFKMFRRMEYFDSVRMDSNSGAWESFAEYLARGVRPTAAQGPVVKVELVRHWVEIPAPTEGEPLVPIGGRWENPSSYRFYVWERKS